MKCTGRKPPIPPKLGKFKIFLHHQSCF